jgi:hypothetical protein
MRPPFEYLCSRCAYRLGGRLPVDYVTTWHLGDCERCNEVDGLAHVCNWTWPVLAQPAASATEQSNQGGV